MTTARSILPALAGLIASGASAEQATAAIAPCEWCGQVHPRLELCPPRPLARGLSRRSFLQLGAAAAVGALVAPALNFTAAEGFVVPIRLVPATMDYGFTDWDPLFKDVYADVVMKQLNDENLLLKWMEKER